MDNENLEEDKIADTANENPEENSNETSEGLNETEKAAEENPNAETWPEDESLESADKQLQIEKDRYMRLYSDFENYKRRSAKERLEFLQLAGRDVIESILPVIDDFERALKAAKSLDGASKAVVDGFELIYKKLVSGMESRGLKPMESIGKMFDVELHEAVTKIPAPEESLKGKVVDEVEKGYTMNEKVIRFAKVIVGE